MNFIKGIQDPFLLDLALTIIDDKRVRKEELKELGREELDDDYSINLWLYHIDMDYNKVTRHAKEYYNNIRKADDMDIFDEDEMI